MTAFHAAKTDVFDRPTQVLYFVMVLDDSFERRPCIVKVFVDLATSVSATFVVTSTLVWDEYTHVLHHLFGLGEASILEVEDSVFVHTVFHQSDDLWVGSLHGHIEFGAVDSEIAVWHWKLFTLELRLELWDSWLDVTCIFIHWWGWCLFHSIFLVLLCVNLVVYVVLHKLTFLIGLS